MKELKKEVLTAYLNQQTPGLSSIKKREWEKRYNDARMKLAERIAIELT